MISNYPAVASTVIEPTQHKNESASDFRYQPDPFDEADRIREQISKEQQPTK